MRGRAIVRAFKLVLNQTIQNFEIIVINSDSRDEAGKNQEIHIMKSPVNKPWKWSCPLVRMQFVEMISCDKQTFPWILDFQDKIQAVRLKPISNRVP